MSAPTLPVRSTLPDVGYITWVRILSRVVLPAPLMPDDAHRLARLDLEIDVAQHPPPGIGSIDPAHEQGELLGEFRAFPVHAEALPDAVDTNVSVR